MMFMLVCFGVGDEGGRKKIRGRRGFLVRFIIMVQITCVGFKKKVFVRERQSVNKVKEGVEVIIIGFVQKKIPRNHLSLS